MDPLVALRDHEPDAEERGPLGRPVAARPAAVLLPREHRQGDALAPVPLGGVEDREHLSAREMGRPRALGPGCELVAEPDVGERAAHHHFVVPATGTVGIELTRRDAMLLQVAPRRRISFYRARRG